MDDLISRKDLVEDLNKSIELIRFLTRDNDEIIQLLEAVRDGILEMPSAKEGDEQK